MYNSFSCPDGQPARRFISPGRRPGCLCTVVSPASLAANVEPPKPQTSHEFQFGLTQHPTSKHSSRLNGKILCQKLILTPARIVLRGCYLGTSTRLYQVHVQHTGTLTQESLHTTLSALLTNSNVMLMLYHNNWRWQIARKIYFVSFLPFICGM